MSRRLMIMPTNHAATTYAKMRGFSATPIPAMISTTPTIIMKTPAGMMAATKGARYCSQSTKRLRNLSSPEIAQRDVIVARYEQKIDDNAHQPRRHDVCKDARL